MTTIEDDDPEYRIAYDVSRRKVGCILIQASLGAGCPATSSSATSATLTWTTGL